MGMALSPAELAAVLEAHGARLQADLPESVAYVLIVASGHMRTAESNMDDDDALRLVRDVAEDMSTDPSRVRPENQGTPDN
jgi:hypothetical protein